MWKRPLKRRVIVLTLALQFLVVGYFVWLTAPKAQSAYLVREHTGKYLIVCSFDDGSITSNAFPHLEVAVKEARERFGMVVARGVTDQHAIERVWVEDRNGRHVVFWKTLSLPYLHRASFSREFEARIFESYIKQGSYTPSPFGHAVLLLPESSVPYGG